MIIIDEEALYNDLRELFLARLYADHFGIIEWDFRKKAIEKYQNDHIFHEKVRLIVASIMDLINKHQK